MQFQKLQAVEKVIASFQASDDDVLYARIAELDNFVKKSAVEDIFALSPMMDLSPEAHKAMLESVEFQEMAANFIWDALRIGVKYEYGMQVVSAGEDDPT